jgi:hypothetical protein
LNLFGENQGDKVGFYTNNGSDTQGVRIENFQDGYLLEFACSPNNLIDAGGSQGNFGDGTDLWMWERNETPPQVFQIFRDATQSFNGKKVVIKSLQTNRYVSVWDDAARSTVARVENYDTASGSWEIMTVKVAEDGWAGFLSACSGKYLTANKNKNEAPLEAAATAMQAWEGFKLYLSGGCFYLKSLANGKWVTAVVDQSNSPLKARADAPSSWERFSVEEPVSGLAEGTYRIINGSGRSLSVLTGFSNVNPKSGQNVCLYDFDGGDPAQRWILKRVGDNVFEIHTPANNVVLNVWGNDPGHGANVNTYGNEGADSQRWHAEKAGDKYVIRLQSNRSIVLTATGSGNLDNVNVSSYAPNNGNQKWTFSKI